MPRICDELIATVVCRESDDKYVEVAGIATKLALQDLF